MSDTPTVAIVGRPNVGKSTLFNRLVGRRQAIVHDLPGVTRDRITARTRLGERECYLIDTGGLVPGDDPLGLNRQVLLAVEESDLVLFVVDGTQGLVSADERVWAELRRFGRPAILVVNKGDAKAAREGRWEFSRLGLEPALLVSAEHGLGVGELVEAITGRLPPGGEEEEVGVPRIAIVGRPNVGKSSLLNRVVGADRVLVSPEPGTTRDPVDSMVERGGRRYLWVDTAGIRRRSRVSDTAEDLAVMMARRQIESADLAVLMLEAPLGVTSGDMAIAGAIQDLGRAALVVVNKWDLLDEPGRDALEASWPRLEVLLGKPPRVNVSALTGRAVDKLYPAIDELLERWALTVPTAEVNRLFERFTRRHRPPTRAGAAWKLFYATQVATRPPTFMLFANRRLERGAEYRRYLENCLRDALPLAGIPVRLVVRRR